MIGTGVCKRGSEIMLLDLNTRFGRYTDESSAEFDATFLIATALDPRYRCILTEKQKEAAKRHLISEVCAPSL